MPSLIFAGALAPLSPLTLALEQDAIVLPEDAWSHERLLGCLAEIATSSDLVDEPPPAPEDGALLHEFDKPLELQSLTASLGQLIERVGSLRKEHPFANTVRALLNLAMEVPGPLKLINGPPVQCDLASFVQHLHSLEEVINAIHTHLSEAYLQSPHFKRSKYELLVLQHMQLLTWLQRVQTGLQMGLGKTGPDMLAFVAQIAHAARVLLFQPLLLHTLQVLHALAGVTAEEVSGSMQRAMTYPSDDATAADRAEWLQLNLLLQFQTVYKTALCQPSIYQMVYSPGEQQLLAGFLRLEEIYTHLISRFPNCCPLSEQEQAVLSDVCRKLNKYFADGKTIKNMLDSSPHTGKQLLVGKLPGGGTSAATVLRDWILPFLIQFTDLLKVLWTLWTKLKREKVLVERQRVGVEMVARQVGRCIIKQLAEEEAALRRSYQPAVQMLPSADLAVGRRAQGSNAAADAAAADAIAANAFSQMLQSIGRNQSSSELINGHQMLQSIGRAAPAPAAAINGYARDAAAAAAAAARNASAATVQDGGGQGWASVVRRPVLDLPVVAAERPKPSMAAAAAVAPAKPKASAVSGAATDDSVRTLVTKRETARFARDFETADKLREQLSRLGVALDDQNKTWRSGDGRTGPITAVNVSELHAQKAAKGGAAPLSDEEIDRMVKEREQARFTLDYKTADKIRETLEKHGVHLDTKENKWQAADGRSGPIGPVNISAAHAQKAARSGVTKSMPLDEIERILVQREQARARRDYRTADVLRDTLEKHGVYLDAKENKWHASDGRTGAIVMSTLSDEEVGKILAARQAARLRHDYKTADRLRDQLNEQCVSVDDKKNRWDASDGRSGNIEPYTCVHSVVPSEPLEEEDEDVDDTPPPASPAAAVARAEAPPAAATTKGESTASAQHGAATKGESKRALPEKARRELAKQLRAVTGASARMCEKALQSHADDMTRAANWLLEQGEHKDVD